MRRFIVISIITLIFLMPAMINAQSIDEALWLLKQGIQAYQYGKYHEALSYFESSLNICRELDIPQGIATSLNNIGAVYKSLGQYDKALEYHKEALKIDRELGISKEIATDLNNIGLVYYFLSQYDKALEYYKEALKIFKELDIPQDIAQSLNNIGAVCHSLGQYDKALEYYKEALKIDKKLDIPQDIATSLNNIGGVYDDLGQYDKALEYHNEALKIFKELDIPEDIATSLNNIGEVYHSLGQYDKALEHYKEALKIRRRLDIPQEIAQSLNNIGLVYYFLSQYDKALEHYKEALKICRKLGIPKNVATTLENIGFVYLSKKEYNKAEAKFKEAEREIKRTGFEWCGNPGLVELYIAKKRYNKAINILGRMIPRWYSDASYRIQYYTQHGLSLFGIGKLKEASKELLSAVELVEDMRERVSGERLGFFGAGYYGGRIRPYKALVAALSERALKEEKKDRHFIKYGKNLSDSAFYFAESTKARVLLEDIAASARRYMTQDIPQNLRKKELSLKNQLSALSRTWEEAYKKGKKAFRLHQERYNKLKAELDRFISKLRREYPRYAALMYPEPFKVGELPLLKDELLLEYEVTQDATYLFVVEKNNIKRIIKIDKTKEEIETLVNEFISPLQSPYTKEDFSAKLAHKLYNLLLKDALSDVSEKTNIIIVPSGILGLLPFEALVISLGKTYRDSQYVADKWSISYYQSASVLALNRMLKESEAKKPLFALANPVYSEEDPRYIAYKERRKPIILAKNLDKYSYRALSTRREWGKELIYPLLPETEDEVKAIAKIFNIKPIPPDVLLGVKANETAFRNTQLDDYYYLHLATHADLAGKVQGIKEPFLLLGQVENRDKDDGFLTLTEVLELKLDAELVVLSACLTGRGKLQEGEGVVNFARAFHHAGARSVLVSLWEVASKETVEYMKLFYRYLKAGKTKAEALRLARNKIKSKYPNPFYWAPFILHGERGVRGEIKNVSLPLSTVNATEEKIAKGYNVALPLLLIAIILFGGFFILRRLRVLR